MLIKFHELNSVNISAGKFFRTKKVLQLLSTSKPNYLDMEVKPEYEVNNFISRLIETNALVEIVTQRKNRRIWYGKINTKPREGCLFTSLLCCWRNKISCDTCCVAGDFLSLYSVSTLNANKRRENAGGILISFHCEKHEWEIKMRSICLRN